MALPITVPFTFANATTTQNLSSLDADFATVYNAVNGIGNGSVSLSNVNITGGTVNAAFNSTIIQYGTSNVSINSSNGPISINTNGNNAMYINTSQNVGIGTTSPTYKLHIYGPSVVSKFESTNNQNIISIANNGTIGGYIGATGNNLILSNSSGNEAMRIDYNGNLLVGTTNPAAKFTSVSSSIVAGYFQSNQASAGYHGVYSEAQNAYGLYGRTYNASYGGVIGFNNDNTVYGILGVGGYGLLTNASININGTTYTSDGRLKENIKTIENGLNVISKLNPVSFDWKEKSSRGPSSDFGLIAQEVEQVIPECVFETITPARTPEMTNKISLEEELGSYKGVDYSRFIPFLIASIKEQQVLIQKLSTEVTALKAKVGQ